MNYFDHLIIADWGNFRGNLWTAIWAIWTIITIYFWLKELNENTKQSVIDRFINESVTVDFIYNLKVLRKFSNIEEWTEINVVIKKVIKTNFPPYSPWNVIINEYWSRSILWSHLENRQWFVFDSVLFEYKILAIKDLAKHTDFNEKYKIFKE